MIQTARLNLLPCDLALWEAILAGDATLSRVIGANVPKKWSENRDAFPYFIRMVKEDPSLERWGAHLLVFRPDNLLIGTGGFKGGPTPEGTVEIGYEIRPSHRQRGLATEAAQGLVDYAFSHAAVAAVMAHTLASENPSTRVLTKLGFLRDGDGHDPDEGLLWRWKLLR